MRVLVCMLTEIAPVKHVKDPPRSSNHYVGHISLELLHLVTDIGATNASMAHSTHVVSKGKNHLLDLKSDKGKDYWLNIVFWNTRGLKLLIRSYLIITGSCIR